MPTKNGTQSVGGVGSSQSYTPEQCAQSSRDVPWGMIDDDSTRIGKFGEVGWRATHSVGGIPFYVRGSTSSYPTTGMVQDGSSRLSIGAREFTDEGFGGPSCTHPDLTPECVVDGDCHPSYRCHQVGHVCVRKNSATCGSDTDPCWCYMHDDCAGTKMCSGTGRCVTPVIEVRNDLQSDPIEFRVYSSSCDASTMSSTDMYGASPWGRIKDVLHSHGLCAHRNW